MRTSFINIRQHPIETLTFWSPTIFTSTLFAITLRYIPASSNSTEDNQTDYWSYIYWTPAYLMGTLSIMTLVSNAMFGRRPNNDAHHNPPYHQIIQVAGHFMPGVLAGLTKLGTFTASTMFGDRASAPNHIANIAIAAIDQVTRAGVIKDRLYDHAMDRSPGVTNPQGTLAIDGAMRFLERIAMHTENKATCAIELAAGGLFVAMQWGLTRLPVNDNNRLAIIAFLYAASDIVESTIIWPVNEYVYYAERWADIPIISKTLLTIGLANLTPVIGVTPKKSEVLIGIAANAGQQVIHNMANAGQQVVHNIANAGQQVAHNIANAVENLTHEVAQDVNIALGETRHTNGNLLHIFGKLSCCSFTHGDVIEPGINN